MDNFVSTLVQQAPYIAAVIIVIYMFQRNEEKREQQRIDNSKAINAEHQAQIGAMNNMWATYIKQIIDQQNATYTAIMQMLDEHEKASKERYKRMGITQDLLEAATERNKERKP